MIYKIKEKLFGLFIQKGEKILNKIIIFLSLNLVLFSGFLLFQAKKGSNITIKQSDENLNFEKNYFGSKYGKYFYDKSCKEKIKIKKENILWFKTKNQAIYAGFEKQKQCE